MVTVLTTCSTCSYLSPLTFKPWDKKNLKQDGFSDPTEPPPVRERETKPKTLTCWGPKLKTDKQIWANSLCVTNSPRQCNINRTFSDKLYLSVWWVALSTIAGTAIVSPLLKTKNIDHIFPQWDAVLINGWVTVCYKQIILSKSCLSFTEKYPS